MCDLFSNAFWLANLTGVTIEYAYNELIDCGGDTVQAVAQCRGAYFEPRHLNY